VTSAEIEENKRHAAFERETAIATKRMSMDEIAISFRWIMASLLAINSAGLAVAINGANLFDAWRILALAFLVLGVVFSLQVGWSLLAAHSLMLKPMGDLVVFWTMAAIDGQIDFDEHKDLAKSAASAAPKYHMPRNFAYLSLLAFAVGVTCVGISATTSPKVDTEVMAGQESK
jgi:hypothetical protein